MARLTKSRNHWIDGVLGGVANYFRVNPDLLRIVFIVGVLFLRMHFLITVYIILMILMPGLSRSEKKDLDDDVIVEESTDEHPTADATSHEGRRVRERKITRDSGRTMQIFGVLLIIAGVVYLIQNQFPGIWYDMERFWYDFRPVLLGVALILGGFLLLYKDKKVRKWFRNK